MHIVQEKGEKDIGNLQMYCSEIFSVAAMAQFLKGPFEVNVTFWPCVLSKLPHGRGTSGSWRC